MKVSKLIFKLFLLSLVFVSCSSDDDNDLDSASGLGISTGDFLISGQGSSAGSGSVSYISSGFDTHENSIYSSANDDKELGIYLQSLAFDEDNAYVVVDNTNTITVVDKASFEEEATITTDLASPKFMTIVGDKGYVTNTGTTGSYVAVLDLETNTVTSTIDVSYGPEKIIENGGKLYITHTYSNALVTVIDIATEAVETIAVDDNPNDLFVNANGDLVVLSQGGTLYDASWNVIGNTKGSIQVIDVATKTITKQFDFEAGIQPSILCEYDGKLYYHLNSKVYELTYADAELPTESILDQTFSDMVVSNGKIYGVDAGDYASQSDFYVYDLATQTKDEDFKVSLGATQVYIVE